MSARSGPQLSAKSASRPAEVLRVLLALSAGLWAIHPFLHNGILGGDDAKWYTAVVADHLEQWRRGFWPSFVGQTRFAAVGTVLPIRIAPYLQHLTVLLDFLTGRTLSAYLLLNLAIVVSISGAALSCYLCLRTILQERRTEALLLAILYVWSPGVIGLPYTGQLFMSVMTLPFLPVIFTGVFQIFVRDGYWGWFLVAAGCAASWLGHTPIALWATSAAFLCVLFRWLFGFGWTRRDLARAGAASGAFLVLCGYVFVSVLHLKAPSAPVSPLLIIDSVHRSFPAALQLISPDARLATDIQLGWSLYAVLFLATALCALKRLVPGMIIGAIGFGLVCLVLPMPGVNPALWNHVPQAFLNATNGVPAQRLYAVISAIGVVTGAAALRTYSRMRVIGLSILGAGIVWSGWELRPFLLRGSLVSNTREVTEDMLRPENLFLTRYSRGFLNNDNRFFSDGVMDWGLEQRVLSPDGEKYLVTDVAALAPSQDFGPTIPKRELPGKFVGTTKPGDHVWVVLEPRLRLEPGKHYLLAMDFRSAEWQGTLQLLGDHFIREYNIPASGADFAFGTGRQNSKVIPLSTSASAPISVGLEFINGDPAADMAQFRDFARYQLITYEPASLPIQLKSLLPYVAQVQSAQAGWLETSRIYCDGWSAQVNQSAAEVRRSPNGLVMARIQAGRSDVTLTYNPGVVVTGSYWLSLLGWLVAGLVAIAGCWRSRIVRMPAPT